MKILLVGVCMQKEEKRIFWGFNPYDYHASEQLLSQMLEKGWMVKDITPYTAVFRSCEPKKKKFVVLIYDKNDISSKARIKYIEQRKKEGLYHVCDYDRYFWFYTSVDDSVPDNTGSEEYLTTSAAWRKELYCLILILLATAFGAVKLYNLSYLTYITYSEFAKLMLLPIFAPICAALSIYFGIWMYRNKKKIRNGEKLPVFTLRAAKIRRVLVFVPVLFFFLVLLTALLLDACTGYAKTVLMLFPIAIVGCVFYIVRLLKKHGKAAFIGRVVIIIAVLICIAFYAFNNYRNYSSDVPDNIDVASITSLGSDYTVKTTSYVHTASPAVSLHFIYKEKAQDGTEANTEYFECRNTFFADVIYNQIEKALKNVDDDYTLTRNGNLIIYQEIKKK